MGDINTSTVTDIPLDGSDAHILEDPSEWHWVMVEKAMYATSSMSIILSFAVLVTFLGMRIRRPAQADRISLRLAVLVAFADLFYGVFVLTANLADASGPLCTSSMYLMLVFSLISFFGTGAIALNLLLVFVLRVRARKMFETAYHVATLLLAITLPLIALVGGRLGWDELFEECWFIEGKGDDDSALMGWKWGVLYIWVTLTCLFCTTTTILVWSVLRKSNPQPIPTSPESGPNCSINDAIFKNTQQRIRRGVARIAVYCLVPILAQFWNIVIDGVQYSNKDPEANWGLFLLANIFSGLQGTMNAIIFFTIDPTVLDIREEIRRHLVRKYYLSKVPTPSTTNLVPSDQPQPRGAEHIKGFWQRTAYRFVSACLLKQEDIAAYSKKTTEYTSTLFTSGSVGKFTSTTPMPMMESGEEKAAAAKAIAFL